MKCKRLPIKYLSPRLQNPGSLSCQMVFLDNDSFSMGSDLVVMAIGHSYKLGHRMVFKALSIFNFEKVCKLLQNTIFMCSVLCKMRWINRKLFFGPFKFTYLVHWQKIIIKMFQCVFFRQDSSVKQSRANSLSLDPKMRSIPSWALYWDLAFLVWLMMDSFLQQETEWDWNFSSFD